ncbi:hypothetical protein FRC05_008183 [Tulasnella sp. 425]|nr:hypothetical protein FRC05_008183 [Tulasnella sp. 425]
MQSAQRSLSARTSAIVKFHAVMYVCFGQSVLEQVPDKEPPSQCVARKVPELCKNYQPGKTEDFNARLSRIEQIIDQVFPQYASGELTSPSSPREFSANLPGTNGPWGSINNGSNDQLMELDRSQDDQKSTASSRSSSPVPGPEPSGGMLEAGKWFGTSALGSVNSRPIIEQLQHSTSGNIGATIQEEHSQVTDKLKSLIQDCGVPPHKLSELVQDLPPRSLSDVLIDYYFTSINYTRYPIYEPSFRTSYEAICNNGIRVHPNDIRFLPLLFVVLAIAARLAPEHILGDERQKRLTSLRYYWSSRRSILIAAAIHSDSFEIILTRILSVRFLTFDRRITECWAQLGAAVRAAQAVGLHRDPGKMNLDPFQTEYRRRIWAYLYHADSTFALLLGRPRAIHDDYCDTLPPLNVDDEEILDHVRSYANQGMPPPQQLPKLSDHPLTVPTHTTFTILRHQLAKIMGHIAHHFQLVRHHSHYSEVLALDEELQRFINKLPPHYAVEPDTSLDAQFPYVPVHRFLIVTEVWFIRISLHRPYVLRKHERFNASRRACFEAARKDFEARKAFKASMPKSVMESLGGAYREFQSAMISGIALVIDPHGPHSAVMHDILEGFLRRHGVGDGAPQILRELDDTTKRELKIIEYLSQKARAAEAQGPRKREAEEDEEEDGDDASRLGEKTSAERSSVRAKRQKSSRSIASAQEANLLLGIAQSGTATPSLTSTASGTTSTFVPGHSKTPSAIAIPRGIGANSPLTRTPIDSPSPKYPNQSVTSPSVIRASPRMVDLAQRGQNDGGSLASSSPSAAEDEHAQRLLDNWCNNVNSLDAPTNTLSSFDPSGLFGNMFSGTATTPGGPMWGNPATAAGGFRQALGLSTSEVPTPSDPSLTGSGALPSSELGSLGGEGADFMYWDALVHQIQGGGMS